MSTKRKIVLELDAQTTGADGVKNLADEIAKLARSGGDAAPEFERLSSELATLAGQQRTVDTFQALAREVEATKVALSAAREEVRANATSVEALQARLREAREAEEQQAAAVQAATRRREEANTSYRAAQAAVSEYIAQIGDARRASEEERAVLEAKRAVVRNTKAEYDSAKAAVAALTPKYRELKDAASGIADELGKQEAALRRSNAAATSAEGTYDEYANALAEVQQQAAALGLDLTQIEREQNRVASAVASATAEYQQLTTRLQEANDNTDALIENQRQAAIAAQRAAEYTQWWANALDAAERAARGVAESKLAEEQRQSAIAAQRAAEYTQWWADALNAAEQEQAAAAAQAGRLREAFAAVGGTATSSSEAIRAEILKINQALMVLAQDATVTGEDFDRAFAQGRARIEELERQLNSAGDEAKRFGGAFGDAFRQFAPATIIFNGVTAAIDGIVQAGRQIPRVTAEFQTLERGLRIITGSTAAARREFEFIQGVANRAGQGVVELGKAYTSLAAATQGTNLQGVQTRRVFEAVAGAMGTLGKSAADTELALQAVQQMVSKGVVSMEEFRQQLGERLPGVLQTTAKELGLTTAELNDLIASGRVTAEDIFPAMSAGLEQLYKTSEKNDTLRGQWTQIANVLKETANAIGDSGLVQSLTDVGRVGLAAATALGEGFVFTGKVVHKVAAGIVAGDLRGALTELGNEAQKFDSRVTRLAGGADSTAPSIRALAEEAQKAGKQFFEMADGTRVATADILGANEGFIRFVLDSQRATSSAENFTTSARKAAEYTRAAGEATITTANALGDEVDKRQAATQVAERNAEALGRLVAAEEKVLAQMRAEALYRAEALRDGTAASDAHKKQLADLGEEIEKRMVVVQGLQNQANASRVLSEALRVEAETSNNNANRVEALAEQYAEFARVLPILSTELANGRITQEQYAAVEQAAMRTKKLYTDAIDDEATALQAIAKISGDERAARDASIQTITRQIDALRLMGQTRTDAYNALQLELAQLQAERFAMNDNATSVNALKDAYASAQSAVETLTAAKAAGKAVDDELREAQLALAAATSAYTDALRDKQAVLDAELARKTAQVTLDQSLARLAIEQARSRFEVARAAGDEADAARALNDIKELEIELARLTARAKRAEAESSLAAVKARREELRVSGQLTDAKEKELRAQELAAEAKKVEADIAEEVADRMEDLADSTDKSGRGAERAAGKYDRLAQSLRGVSGAAQEAGDALDNVSSNWDEDGNLINSGGDDLRKQMRQQTDGGGSNFFDDAIKKYGLGDQLSADDRSRFNELAAFEYQKLRATLNSGVTWSSYFKYLRDSNRGAVQNALKMLDAEKANANSAANAPPGVGRPDAGGDADRFRRTAQPTAERPAAPAREYTVNVNLGGRQSRIAVASQSDADRLVGLLKTLETSAGTAY